MATVTIRRDCRRRDCRPAKIAERNAHRALRFHAFGRSHLFVHLAVWNLRKVRQVYQWGAV